MTAILDLIRGPLLRLFHRTPRPGLAPHEARAARSDAVLLNPGPLVDVHEDKRERMLAEVRASRTPAISTCAPSDKALWDLHKMTMKMLRAVRTGEVADGRYLVDPLPPDDPRYVSRIRKD